MSVNANCSLLAFSDFIDSRLELFPYKMYCDICSYPFFFARTSGAFLAPVCRGFKIRAHMLKS